MHGRRKKVESVGVIGAGPAGLSAAYVLASRGVNVHLFEASNSVGGMAKTIPLWDQLVDLGPHRFFSSDPRVNRVWLDMAGQDYEMVSRLTRIYYNNTFFDYPLKALNALQGLGLYEATRCLISYAFAKVRPERDESTFDKWVSNRFGERLFTIFFKSYSEKLWGIACSELDADFAAQRIKKLSLYEAVKSALFSTGSTKHKTLVDEFAYPKLGAGAIYERMAVRIAELGGTISRDTPVRAVKPAPSDTAPATIELEGGETFAFDHVVSSMPITILVDRMGAPSDVREHARALTFRNTILVYLRVHGDSPFPDQWIYVHSTELKTGRITNFRNWSPDITKDQKDTILCLEYWCYDGENEWSMEEDELIDPATREIYLTSLVPDGAVLEGKVVRVPKCYPVYKSGYRTHLAPVEKFLTAQRKISVIGRYGAFKYNNQDHSILMGLLAAENIVEDATHDLWGVNADYEYQESSKITATGLSQS